MSVVLVDCLLIAGKRERRPALRINVRGMVIGIAGDGCSSPEGNKLAKHREKGRAGGGGAGDAAQTVSEESAVQWAGGGLFFLFPPNGRRVAWH